MNTETTFSEQLLAIDCVNETEKITASIRDALKEDLKRKGLVLGISGGIDSSVCAALAVEALGENRVLALMMPEQDSNDDSVRLGQMLADHFGFEVITENITPILNAFGCYKRRNEAIRQVIPEFGDDWKCKIVLPSILNTNAGFRIFSIVAMAPDGTQITERLTPQAYLSIVAATNFKQRTRKMLEYFHADRLNYAVIGTPNRLEYDQGFFVKNGDGSADIKPIAHLYKTQVYTMARYLGVPAEICSRPPTTMLRF